MDAPKVSVIIPAYNGAKFLGEAIKSILGQTYTNFELIVVDDASTDNTNQIVNYFDDPRLKYLVHDRNRGSDLARDTGLRASSGEIIAFLDQDDFFHPEKLQAHVKFLEGNLDVGFTYNARFELNYSSTTIRGIWRPPENITLKDLVLWFPLSPSDVVLRRKWALRMDLKAGSLSWCGGEIVHFGGLFMDGCKFGSVNRALNYRRYHSRRIIKDLSGGCESEIFAQEKVLSDPRCPPEIVALKDVAHANIYMFWAFRAFAQNDTTLGQKFIREAARLKPSIIEGSPCELVIFLVINCIDDEGLDHADLLKKMFSQFPPEMVGLVKQFDWAVARGYLMKGARAVLWNRPDDGHRHFEQAAKLKAKIDDSYIDHLTQNLLDYETEFGLNSSQIMLEQLAAYLEILGGKASVRQLKSNYAFNRALQSYRKGEFSKVPGMVFKAVSKNPKYLTNRGAMAILLRTTIGRSFNLA